MDKQYDVIVIGAGPGGYVTALKSAKLGFKTAVVEKDKPGGTCLNRGCIPTKAMIHASDIFREMQSAAEYGIFAENVRYDYEKILSYRDDVINKLVSGVGQLFKANGVELLEGTGTLEKDGSVTVRSAEGEIHCKAKHTILAVGSKPATVPIPGLDSEGVLNSDEIFKLTAVPESLSIIGGGVIGVEFASIFAALGTKVTILEALPSILANMDKDFAQNLKMILKKRGVEVHAGVQVKEVKREGDMVSCIYLDKEQEEKISSRYVLCAVGRVPATEGLFGEGVSLTMERGRVIVDEHFKTSMDGVYAIGDLIPGMQLAHLASAQGICLMEELAGEKRSIDLSVVPSCVYTSPEIASVGITEAIAKDKGIEIEVGKFMMSANGKSLISKEERGYVKILADKETKAVLGVQMMCARATDMIGEFGNAVANGFTVLQLLKAMRAHPTYNEAVGEALEDVFSEAVHAAPKRK